MDVIVVLLKLALKLKGQYRMPPHPHATKAVVFRKVGLKPEHVVLGRYWFKFCISADAHFCCFPIPPLFLSVQMVKGNNKCISQVEKSSTE